MPKEQWTKYEELEQDNFSLELYLKEVIGERREKNGQRSELVVKICGYAWSQHIFMKLVQPESQFKSYLLCRRLILNKCLL